ncbi:2-hydroxyacyl-CoA dehydratase family protein [uncultured Parvimonas sp.]|uniref:2-hydroxyacyl-CoA dehydratase family protein n=1 Tax=uncultured Parvimonas sp. TaxID=747372 RepID=UPI0028D67F3C|nr:2-hydroxyacyl-CoA dehydratase family protein [uncultured Parvimonas sp.]
MENLREEILELRRNAFIETIMGLDNERYIIGYLGKTVPKEIFYGFDLVPLPLDGVDRYILNYSNEKNLCSIVNSTLTYALTKKCPLIYNAKLLVVDNSCPLLLKTMKEKLKDKIYFYDGNVEKLKNRVVEVYNIDFFENKFLNAVELTKIISSKLEKLSKTDIDSRFLYEVEFYTQFIFSLEDKITMIDRVLSNYNDVDKKRQKLYVPRAIQILDDIDKRYKDYQIVENFCLGEVFKTYKKSGYEFLKEKYNENRVDKLDILFENCPYDNK